MNKALFAGTFDPFTLGHEYIVRKALSDFDEVIIGVGVNEEKTPFLDLQKRVEMIKKVFEGEGRVSVYAYEGLTVDFARKMGAKYLVRGLRNEMDKAYEKFVEDYNRNVAPEITTVYYYADADHEEISSTAVREKLLKGEDVSKYLPKAVADYLKD